MFKEYLLLLFLGHILGDFYTQTSKIAEKKNKQFKWVLIHSLIYFFTVFVVSIPVISGGVLILDIVAAFLHAFIDILKYLFMKKRKKEASAVFVTDQCLHLICLVVMSYIWTGSFGRLVEIPVVLDFFTTSGISEKLVVSWIIGLLTIHKPANILIQNLIAGYKPRVKGIEIKADNNVGRLIGTVERIIMFILIYMNQYSAIGLVLTAKSIARYDRIAKDEKFAEYYLLGTLISAGIVIVCAALLF